MGLTKELIFPALLILWNLGAALIYFRLKNWRRRVYFISCRTVLNL